ncbi:uncharacterized protein LOC120594493 [Pteropus medius]|uniref:uncharacterized protein LOC120594493 n=1 Tax=Pteropus vampyrus TaxID=132908 RepID=UPI00196A89B2|nr:uncharacterized protein LOC120594493 [Pteropus giganteus]
MVTIGRRGNEKVPTGDPRTVADAWSPAGADWVAARGFPGEDRSTQARRGRRGRFLAGSFGPAAPTEGTAPRKEEGSIRQETDRVRGLGDVLGAGGVYRPWSAQEAEVASKTKVRAAGPVSRAFGSGGPGRGESLAAFKRKEWKPRLRDEKPAAQGEGASLNGQQTITRASQKGLLSSHATHLLPIQLCSLLPLPDCARLHDSARVCQHLQRHTVESSRRPCPQEGDMRHMLS